MAEPATQPDGGLVLKNIRTKYPQYGDMTDQALASAVVKKYPQYTDVLSDIASPPSVVQRGYRAVKGAVAKPFELAGDLDVAVSKMPEGPLKQFLGGGGRMLHSETPAEAKQHAAAISENLTPILLTAPLIGGGSALGSAASEAAGVLPRLLPAAGRVAASTLGGSLIGAGEGKGAVRGAEEGALGGTLGEAAGAASTRVGQAIPGLVRKVEGSRIGQAMSKVFPELQASSSKELSGLVENGQTLIDNWFNGPKGLVNTALKQRGVTAIKVPELGGGKALTLDRALDELSGLRGMDRFKARGALIARLEQLAPGSGQTLDQALSRRAAQRAYLTVLTKGMDPKTGQLDTSRVMRYVNANVAKLKRFFGADWPAAQGALLRGQRFPAQADLPAFSLHAPGRGVMNLVRGRYAGSPQPLQLGSGVQAAIDALGQSPVLRNYGLATGIVAGEKALAPVRWAHDLILDRVGDLE